MNINTSGKIRLKMMNLFVSMKSVMHMILTQWHCGKISIERLGQWDISQEKSLPFVLFSLDTVV